MTMQIRARQLFARRRPALGTKKNPVVLPPHIQFVDSRFRPVEARSHLHHRDRSDYLVDLNDTEKTVPGEPVQQEIHDVRYGRGRRRKRSVASPTEPATCGGLRSIHETKPSRVSLRTEQKGSSNSRAVGRWQVRFSLCSSARRISPRTQWRTSIAYS